MKTKLTLLPLLCLACILPAASLQAAASAATNQIRGSELTRTNRVYSSNTFFTVVYPYPHPYYTNGTMQISGEDLLESLKLFPGWPAGGSPDGLTNSESRAVTFSSSLDVTGPMTNRQPVQLNSDISQSSGGVAALANVTAATLNVNGTNVTAQLANLNNATNAHKQAIANLQGATNGLDTRLTVTSNALYAATGSGTNQPWRFSGGTLIGSNSMTTYNRHATNASAAFTFPSSPNASMSIWYAVSNQSSSPINFTNTTGWFDPWVGSNVTTFAIAGTSIRSLLFTYTDLAGWRALDGSEKQFELGAGTNISLSTNNGVISINGTASGSSTFNETNIIVSTTNEIVLNVAAFDIAKILLLTNLNRLTFSNSSTMGKRGNVYIKQDTNGTRTIANWNVAGGVLQMPTNHTTTLTTNANANDLLEVMPGYFPTNIFAWWPQDFHPRIAATNSLHNPTVYYSNAVAADSPVGYWRLDSPSGSTMVDSSGNGYNGTYTNSPTLNVSGVLSNNTAASFNYASTQCGAVADNAALSITGALTVECWLNATAGWATHGGNQGLVCKYLGSAGQPNERGYALYVATNVIGFVISSNGVSGSATTVLSPGTFTSNAWHHVVATYTPSTSMAIYIDGSLVTNRTTTVPHIIFDNAAPLQIGTQFDPANNIFYWNGKLDECAVYNTALSAGRISAHYNADKN